MPQGDCGWDGEAVMTRKKHGERGLAGAMARGREAREAWVREGVLVSREQFAERWGVSVEELAQMVAKGELFELEVLGQMWLPAVLLEVPRAVAVKVNLALTETGTDAAGALVFWHRRHGALRGMSVREALHNVLPTKAIHQVKPVGRRSK
jgi:hypothetical protein